MSPTRRFWWNWLRRSSIVVTNEMPWLEWAINVSMCISVWAVLSLVFKYLQSRKVWNDVMTVACFMWVLFLRFRHPAAAYVPMAVFALGAYKALDQTTYKTAVRAALALVIGFLWMEFGIHRLIGLMYYFCAGCFFGK